MILRVFISDYQPGEPDFMPMPLERASASTCGTLAWYHCPPGKLMWYRIYISTTISSAECRHVVTCVIMLSVVQVLNWALELFNGIKIIAPHMEFLHLNWYIAECCVSGYVLRPIENEVLKCWFYEMDRNVTIPESLWQDAIPTWNGTEPFCRYEGNHVKASRWRGLGIKHVKANTSTSILATS